MIKIDNFQHYIESDVHNLYLLGYPNPHLILNSKNLMLSNSSTYRQTDRHLHMWRPTLRSKGRLKKNIFILTPDNNFPFTTNFCLTFSQLIPYRSLEMRNDLFVAVLMPATFACYILIVVEEVLNLPAIHIFLNNIIFSIKEVNNGKYLSHRHQP